MEYVCKVGTPAGEVVERAFVAADEGALRADLEQQGFYLFAIKRGLRLGDFGLRPRKLKTSVLLVFGQELAALLKAGLPLYQSLDIMLERQRDPAFRASLSGVREKVKAGVALSDAFKAEGDLYPPIFAASLVAGERSGNIETVLRRFVQHVRLNQGLRRKAVGAAIYPIAILLMMLVMAAVMLLFVIPQFQDFYEGLGAGQLPLVTRVLLVIAAAARANLVVISLAVLGGAVAFTVWRRRAESGVTIDRILLRIPFAGAMMRMYATSQLTRTLSTLLMGGLPLINALEVAAGSMGNRAMALAVSSATPQVREGKSLTTALESTGMIENLPLEMVKVGEQTGALADMLNTIAEFYDEEIETRLQVALSLLEPIILVAMAVLVAGMLLAFYLPMFQAISAVERAH
ncbi:MAG: type II secretion system F family protein [Vicinamibacteria bacterium]